MQKEDVIKSLREEMPVIKQRFGVRSIGLFGSIVKDLGNSESDIDILVDMEPDFHNFMGLLLHLEKKMSSKIDLVRKGPHLSQKFLEHITNDMIYA